MESLPAFPQITTRLDGNILPWQDMTTREDQHASSPAISRAAPERRVPSYSPHHGTGARFPGAMMTVPAFMLDLVPPSVWNQVYLQVTSGYPGLLRRPASAACEC